MKLSTYKLEGNNKELIGLLKNNSLINLNNYLIIRFSKIVLNGILKVESRTETVFVKEGEAVIVNSG